MCITTITMMRSDKFAMSLLSEEEQLLPQKFCIEHYHMNDSRIYCNCIFACIYGQGLTVVCGKLIIIII